MEGVKFVHLDLAQLRMTFIHVLHIHSTINVQTINGQLMEYVERSIAQKVKVSGEMDGVQLVLPDLSQLMTVDHATIQLQSWH